MKNILILLVLFSLTSIANAANIEISHANDKFQKEWQASTIEKIEHWDQPKRAATPKNLRSEQQIRYSGRTSDGKLTSWTQHVTDYDTYITSSEERDGSYYITDNTGKSFKTGDSITDEQKENMNKLPDMIHDIDRNKQDIEFNKTNIENISNNVEYNNYRIEQNENNIEEVKNDVIHNSSKIENNTQKIEQNKTEINNVKTNVNKNTTNISNNSNRITHNENRITTVENKMNNIQNQHNDLNGRVNNLDKRIKSGLAMSSALTSLHPNPKAKGDTQLSIGAGYYRDNVATAIGAFHNIDDDTMVSVGAAYGGRSEYTGNVGITFSF